MDILEKENLELQNQIETLKTRSSRVACIERFCNLLGHDADKQPVAPDAMVDAFQRCDLRVVSGEQNRMKDLHVVLKCV